MSVSTSLMVHLSVYTSLIVRLHRCLPPAKLPAAHLSPYPWSIPNASILTHTHTHTHTHTLRTGYDGGRHLTVLRILAMAHHAYVGVTQLPENTESVNTSHLGILGFAVGVSTVLHKFKPTNPSMLDTVSQVLLPTPTLPSPTSAAGSLAPSGGGGGEGEGGGGGGGGMAEDSDCPGMARVWLQVCVCVCVRVCVYA